MANNKRTGRNTNYTAPTPKNILSGKSALNGAIKRATAYELMCDGYAPEKARAIAQTGEDRIVTALMIIAQRNKNKKKKTKKEDKNG